MSALKEWTITRPDDWHLHLRDDEAMASIVAFTAARCGRAIVMPNLRPPVVRVEQAMAYRQRILDALGSSTDFQPLMTLYLTDETPVSEIEAAIDNPHIAGVKLYPAGATTNSDSGVTDLSHCADALAAMEKGGIPLLVHGEVTDASVDIFDREKVFIDEKLVGLLADFPGLRVVLEHITTSEAVDFVRQGPANLAATITPHHLLLNRNDMLVGGIRPHYYCLPILKRQRHQAALIEAATSGDPKFFLGTDSAPHPVGGKETVCGCAGVFSAHGTIELYAEAFEAAGAMEHLEGFASFFGPDFYGLERNRDTITLRREAWQVPESYPLGAEGVRPFRAGETISWKMQ
jgi:dihydroorotase